MRSSILAILITLCACASHNESLVRQLYEESKATKAENWDLKLLDRPLLDKIQPAPAIVLDYIKIANRLDGFDEVPESYELTGPERLKLLNEFSRLPPVILQLIQERLVGIYGVRNLGGTGLAGSIYDGDRPIAGFIVLDYEVLRKPANEWISFKENSVFKPSGNTKLEVKIASNADNTRERGISFIFIHELGHVFHEVYGLMPSFQSYKFRKTAVNFASSYMKDVWTSPDDTIYDESFPERKQIKFYRDDPSFSTNDATRIYTFVQDSKFPTLYSTVDPHEDFAEGFVTYVHCVLSKRPYQVTVREGNQVLFHSDMGVRKSLERTEYFRKALDLVRKRAK